MGHPDHIPFLETHQCCTCQQSHKVFEQPMQPPQRIVDHTFICASNNDSIKKLERLDKMIHEMIKVGWQPMDAPFHAGVMLCQRMVKYA